MTQYNTSLIRGDAGVLLNDDVNVEALWLLLRNYRLRIVIGRLLSYVIKSNDGS